MWEVEVEAQKKYEDLLEHTTCHERHITWTVDKEGNYHFYPYQEIRELIWKCTDQYTKGKHVFKVLHSLLVTNMSNGQTCSTASLIISHFGIR